MESLIKQTMRVRFTAFGQNTQEGPNKLPPQNTSFKGGSQTQNWFQRQFSGQMNHENDSSDGGEFATAIAAAAFAIYSLEEAELRDPKKMTEGSESSLTKSKTRKEDNMAGLPGTSRVSKWFSRTEAKEDEQSPGEASIKKSEVADQRKAEGMTLDRKTPENTAGRVPSIKKTISFADENLNGTARTGSMKRGTSGDARPTVNHTLSAVGSEKLKGNSTVPGDAEAKAAAWEKAEMARIKKRYEKTNTTILSWENEKKTKAKHQLDKIENQLEKRRTRNLQRYRFEISQIDQIAAEAKAAAEKRRRNEESKTKEKAKKIRSTGNVPATCFCF